MATTITLYNAVAAHLLTGTVDPDTDTLKIALLSSAYSFDAAHTEFAEVSANEIAGTGYTAGGQILSNVAVSQAGDLATLDCDDIVWPSASITARWAVIYAEVVRNSVTNPLIAAILLDDTPADVSSTNSDFTLQISASGLLFLGVV